MRRLISEELLNRYLVKSVKSGTTEYRTVFAYTGNVVNDTHEVLAGFETDKARFVGRLFLPTLREDGMLQRNQSVWYPVYMVVPPMHVQNYKGFGSARFYLENLISDSTSASSMADFFPRLTMTRPVHKTRLSRELFNDEPVDFNDTTKWLAIDTATAIIEAFNHKVLADIRHYIYRPGFRGVSACIRGVHTLVNAFTRYFSDEGEELIAAEAYDTNEGELLKRIGIEDARGVLVIHPDIRQATVRPDTPIDFCSCSTSHPMQTARIKDGVEVVDCRFAGTPSFPYARYRRAIPGILSDDPHRVIVSRAIFRSMILDEPDTPYVSTEVELGADVIALPGVRMSHALNYEDGILVSRTFARKAGAYKVYVDRMTLPADSHISLTLPVYQGEETALAAKFAAGIRTADMLDCDVSEFERSIASPGDVIGTVQYKDLGENSVTENLVANPKAPGVLVDCVESVPASDVEEPVVRYKLVYLAYLPVEVGSKVADLHGNKATVSAILPDDEMPIWQGERVHYIATPYIMKRLAMGAEIEDKLALIGRHRREPGSPAFTVKSDMRIPVDELDAKLAAEGLEYTGAVFWNGKVYDGVPLSLRAMVRIDNNPVESLSAKGNVRMDRGKRVSNNARISLDLVTLVSRKAANLVHEFIEHSGSREFMNDGILPRLYALSGTVPEGAKTYEVTKRLPREILGNPVSSKSIIREPRYRAFHSAFPKSPLRALLQKTEMNREYRGTACDARAVDHYGIVTMEGSRLVVVPPHEPFRSVSPGMYVADAVGVAANRVVAEVISRAGFGAANTNVDYTVNVYRSTLAGSLRGKRGLIAEALYPVYPKSIRGVVSPYLGEDPFEIMVPRKAFRKLVKQSDDAFRALYDKGRLAILKRDPVHQEEHVVCVRFGLWDHNTIGVNPLIIRGFCGDFDGDEVTVAFASTSAGYHDLSKLSTSFPAMYDPGKQLCDVGPDRAREALVAHTGWASTFTAPHESDRCGNPELYQKLLKGLDMKTAPGECLKAAADFTVIKEGTAFAGALGLRFIYSRKAEDARVLRSACRLYHALAQNTLDAKSGVSTPALEVVDAFRTGDVARMADALDVLGYTEPVCLAELSRLCLTIKDAGSMMDYLCAEHPVLAAIQRGSRVADVTLLAKRLMNGEPMGGGVFDVMFDYLLGRTERSPYDYVDALTTAFREIMEKESGTTRNTAQSV